MSITINTCSMNKKLYSLGIAATIGLAALVTKLDAVFSSSQKPSIQNILPTHLGYRYETDSLKPYVECIVTSEQGSFNAETGNPAMKNPTYSIGVKRSDCGIPCTIHVMGSIPDYEGLSTRIAPGSKVLIPSWRFTPVGGYVAKESGATGYAHATELEYVNIKEK